MKKWFVLALLSVMTAWCQKLDLSSLEKVASRARETNEVNLDANQIRAALTFLPHDEKDNVNIDGSAKKLLAGLRTITIRNYEFDKPGVFQDADLDPVRSQLAKLKGWAKIVDSRDKDERSEVYMFTEDGKPTGIAVIDLEPKELSVVLVKGTSSLADIGKLNGMMGLPHIKIGSELKIPAKSSH